MKSKVKTIFFVVFACFVFVAGSFAGGYAKAGKKGGDGMPQCSEVVWEFGGQKHMYEVWYTDKQFIVRDHGPVCIGSECKDKTTEEGMLLPPPKDSKKKVGL